MCVYVLILRPTRYSTCSQQVPRHDLGRHLLGPHATPLRAHPPSIPRPGTLSQPQLSRRAAAARARTAAGPEAQGVGGGRGGGTHTRARARARTRTRKGEKEKNSERTRRPLTKKGSAGALGHGHAAVAAALRSGVSSVGHLAEYVRANDRHGRDSQVSPKLRFAGRSVCGSAESDHNDTS